MLFLATRILRDRSRGINDQFSDHPQGADAVVLAIKSAKVLLLCMKNRIKFFDKW